MRSKKKTSMSLGSNIRVVLMVILLIALAGVGSFASGEVQLILDGKKIETDVAPIIVEGRTLVPYRALLESMGGTVDWEEKASMATAVLGNKKVQITVNNKTAFVNGIRHELDVPAIIKQGRVLIPVRFVLENLDCKVDWDPKTRSVLIDSPPKFQANRIQDISYQEKDGGYRITVTGTNGNPPVASFSYDSPERFGVNIKGSILAQGVGSLKVSNPIISGVRFSQFDNDTVRIVVDLKEKVAGRISFSDDGKEIYIDFGKEINKDTPGQDQTGTDNKGDTQGKDLSKALPALDWKAKGKLVVIDPGHGGRDSGAAGKVNGKTVLVEKDLNLDIALIVNDLLKKAGANVVMLRDKDVWMELYERPERANKLKADLFVSIHNNGYDGSTVPNGVEVLYYDNMGIEEYGISSSRLARFIQDELYPRTGLQNRGIKNSPHLAVLNKTLMPAVIIEGGFLSNPGDLQAMLKPEYKEGYAVAAAIGIIKSLNYWVDQE